MRPLLRLLSHQVILLRPPALPLNHSGPVPIDAGTATKLRSLKWKTQTKQTWKMLMKSYNVNLAYLKSLKPSLLVETMIIHQVFCSKISWEQFNPFKKPCCWRSWRCHSLPLVTVCRRNLSEGVAQLICGCELCCGNTKYMDIVDKIDPVETTYQHWLSSLSGPCWCFNTVHTRESLATCIFQLNFNYYTCVSSTFLLKSLVIQDVFYMLLLKQDITKKKRVYMNDI